MSKDEIIALRPALQTPESKERKEEEGGKIMRFDHGYLSSKCFWKLLTTNCGKGF